MTASLERICSREKAIGDLLLKFREFKKAAARCRKLGVSSEIPTGAMMPRMDVKNLQLITVIREPK